MLLRGEVFELPDTWTGINAAAKADGAFGSMSYDQSYYACVVHFNGSVTSYLSLDGSTWIQTGSSNMECNLAMPDHCTNLSDLTNYDTTRWNSLITQIHASATFGEGSEAANFTQAFGYMRFNTDSEAVDGTSASCPSLDIGTPHNDEPK